MPNQLKPKKLDLPHLQPCSHLLQTALQGRIGQAGCLSAGECGHQQAGPCARGVRTQRHRHQRRARSARAAGLCHAEPTQPQQPGQFNQLGGRTGWPDRCKHPPRPRLLVWLLLLLPCRFPAWLEGAGDGGKAETGPAPPAHSAFPISPSARQCRSQAVLRVLRQGAKEQKLRTRFQDARKINPAVSRGACFCTGRV